MTKREWFVAIADMSGEYEGNPPCFDAATIYGPYTAKQALAASKLDDGFPHASYAVTIFKPDTSLNHQRLMELIRSKVAEAQAEAEQATKEMDEAKDRARGGRPE